MSANGPQKAPDRPRICASFAANGSKPKKDHILGYVAQSAIAEAPNPPITTHFWWCSPLKIALTDTQGSVLGPNGQRQPATSSPQRWVTKGVFLKIDLDHLRCLNKLNEPFVSPLQAILAPPKSQNALKIGCFATKNGSEMGQKCVFQEMILGH